MWFFSVDFLMLQLFNYCLIDIFVLCWFLHSIPTSRVLFLPNPDSGYSDRILQSPPGATKLQPGGCQHDQQRICQHALLGQQGAVRRREAEKSHQRAHRHGKNIRQGITEFHNYYFLRFSVFICYWRENILYFVVPIYFITKASWVSFASRLLAVCYGF